MWNIEPDSYPQIASGHEKITDHVLDNAEPGSIILLHIMYESRTESLNSIEGIQKLFEDELSEAFINGHLKEDYKVKVTIVENKLGFEYEKQNAIVAKK